MLRARRLDIKSKKMKALGLQKYMLVIRRYGWLGVMSLDFGLIWITPLKPFLEELRSQIFVCESEYRQFW